MASEESTDAQALRQCPSCGRLHSFVQGQVAFRKPDALLQIPEAEWAERCWAADSEDMCQIEGGRSFIRGHLPIPVIGRQHPWGWGVWVEVWAPDLHKYWELFRDPDQGNHPPFRAVIANEIVSYGESTLGLRAWAQMVDERTRPVVTVASESHQLWAEQQRGITEERVAEFLHDYFHERLELA